MADSNQIGFRVLFEDQHLLVLSKDAGLLSQGDHSGDPSLVDFLRVRFGREYVGLVHRLDRNTSGLMVVAKRSKSAERLTAQLIKGELVRKYHAVVMGRWDAKPNERWEHWLLKNEKTNEVRAVKPQTPGAKHSVLSARILLQFYSARNEHALSLLEFELETGRSHQIRVQSAAQGHPLVGDTKYGKPPGSTLFSRPALHSAYLSFYHPMTREMQCFTEPLSEDLLTQFPDLQNYFQKTK